MNRREDEKTRIWEYEKMGTGGDGGVGIHPKTLGEMKKKDDNHAAGRNNKTYMKYILPLAGMLKHYENYPCHWQEY
ncbi:MAG: hypothetical protein ACQER7_10595 [Bacteroidota bacterium]